MPVRLWRQRCYLEMIPFVISSDALAPSNFLATTGTSKSQPAAPFVCPWVLIASRGGAVALSWSLPRVFSSQSRGHLSTFGFGRF